MEVKNAFLIFDFCFGVPPVSWIGVLCHRLLEFVVAPVLLQAAACRIGDAAGAPQDRLAQLGAQ